MAFVRSARNNVSASVRCLTSIALLACTLACKDERTAPPNVPSEQAAAKQPGDATATGVRAEERTFERNAHTFRLWVYRPSAPPKGLVLIAPAGSNLLTGMAMSPQDRPEHLPYVEAGYVVVAYDLEGAMASDGSDAEVAIAMSRFFEDRLGVDSARAALDRVVAEIDEGSPVYVAGHSSAGTLALQVAALDDRIDAVIAYAPVTDLSAHFGPEFMQGLADEAPELHSTLQGLSPLALASRLRKPVFVFHSRADTVIEAAQSRTFVAVLEGLDVDVTYREVAEGDHYNSMIEAGIPAALEWLSAKRDANPS